MDLKGLSSPARVWKSSGHAVSLEKVIYIFVFQKSHLCYWLLDCKGVNRFLLSFQPFLLIPLPFITDTSNTCEGSQLHSGLSAPLCPFLGRLQAGVSGLQAALSAPSVNPRLSPLGFPYVYINLREKKCSLVVAHLPWPCYGSSIEISAVFWSQSNLSLLPLFSG